MNPELQKALADIIATLRDGAQYAALAAKQELPILVKEYLRWGFAEALIYLVCALSVVTVCALAMRWAKRYGLNPEDADTPAGLMVFFISGVFCLGALGVAIEYAVVAIKITIAPRVYLLEQIGKLV
jgi:hypothetical protein